jgi:hypothetical protein
MAMITLSKAARLQESIRRKIGTLPLRAATSLLIFVADTRGEVDRRAAALAADIGRVDRLLSILGEIRAVAGTANAESGIAALLAEKAGMEERVKLLGALLPTAAREPRHFAPQTILRDADTIAEQVRAMRARYETGEGEDDTIETSLLDEPAAAALRERVVAAQRRLEDIGDRLRELNTSVRIEIADDVLAWLRSENVI